MHELHVARCDVFEARCDVFEARCNVMWLAVMSLRLGARDQKGNRACFVLSGVHF